MGNRGVLHDDEGRIVRSYQIERWITCLLEYKGRRRELMRPGFYTELFFWDDARRQGVVDAAAHKAETGTAPVWTYLFAWNSPVLDGVAGAWHVADVPHAFNNVALIPQATGGGADAQALAHDVSQAFVAFARTGDPSHDGLPAWVPWTPETGATMVLDDHSELRERHDQPLLDILAGAEQG